MLTTELDRATQILQWAVYCAVILGNPTANDFELIEVGDGQLPKERFPEFSTRGLRFIGVLGVGQGGAKCALDEPLEESTVADLSLKFLRAYLSKRMDEITSAAPQLKNAGVAYLEQLFTLPDTRTAN